MKQKLFARSFFRKQKFQVVFITVKASSQPLQISLLVSFSYKLSRRPDVSIGAISLLNLSGDIKFVLMLEFAFHSFSGFFCALILFGLLLLYFENVAG